MQGYIRRLVNPPTTLKQYEAEKAARIAEDEARAKAAEVPSYTVIEAQGIHTPGSLTVTAYDSITLDRSVVAVHCKGQVITDGAPVDARFVLHIDPVEFGLFLKHGYKALQYVEAKRLAAAQAALEQDCDRREEIIRERRASGSTPC